MKGRDMDAEQNVEDFDETPDIDELDGDEYDGPDGEFGHAEDAEVDETEVDGADESWGA